MTKLLFLPGAVGSAAFWLPVAERLRLEGRRHFFSWPGLGDERHDPDVQAVDDLVRLVVGQMSEPCDLIAQSMGGFVAMRAALAAPTRVRRLVLTATSGGLPVRDLGAADWKKEYRDAYPNAAPWITEVRQDLTLELGSLFAPTALIWGGVDAISPVTVGERLARLLPCASLHIIPAGGHDLARTHPAQVAALIEAHLV